MSSTTAGRRGSAMVSPALAVASVALLAVVALIVALSAGAFATGSHATAMERTVSAPAGSGLNAAELYAATNPGVVDITVHTAQGTQTGTGIVLDDRGRILTADHVIAGARSITVRFQDGANRTAKLLGGNTGTDVAVVGVDPSGLTLHPLPLGSESGLRVGDPVAVIGDPFDVQRSLSTSVISGLDRTIQAPNGFTIPHAIQTDAAINPGNSGGPVLDAGGRVIGIADQIATGSSGIDSSTGVGFAVPIDIVENELSQLEAGIGPSHAFLGISAAEASDGQGDAGALVQAVQPGGPAARAGVSPGDLIVAIGSTSIRGVDDIVAATATYSPSARTTITVSRHDKRLSLAVTLTKQPAKTVSG